MTKHKINLEVNPRAEKIRLISFELAIAALISLYLTGVVMAFLNSGIQTCFNIDAIITAFREMTFQYELFLTFFFIGAAIVAFTAYKQLSYIDRKDLFGRFLFGVDGTYGTARFAKMDELTTIAKKEPIEEAYGTIYGQFTTGGRKVFDYKMSDGKHTNDLSNRNIMAIGATGSGKTFGFVQPYLLQAVKRRESVILPDPSGEIYKRYTWFLREQCGYKVHHIIFNDEIGRKSAGWNVLSVLKGDPEIDAAIFSQIIFQANGTTGRPDAHIEMARMLFEAIYLYIMLNPNRKPEKKVWSELIDIIGQPGGFTYFDEIFATSNISVEQVPAQQLYNRCKASENFGTNILATLRSNLKIAATSIMKTVLSTTEIDVNEAGRVPTIIFCQFPEGDEAFKLLTSMFFALSFIALYNYADSMPDGRLPVHVSFLIDEAKAVGKIPDLEDKLVTMRKRNLSLCTIFQDISQFQKLYGMDTWNTLFGASAVKMVLGAQDDTTPKLISEFIGKCTVATRSEKREAMESPTKQSRESTLGQTGRLLLTPDEVRGLGEKEMILVLFAYRSPVILYRCYANLHPLYHQAKQPFDINLVPDITDKKNRQLYINYCEGIFNKYHEKHKNEEPDYSEVWKTKSIFSKSRKRNKTKAVQTEDEEAEKQFRNQAEQIGEKPKKEKRKKENSKQESPKKKKKTSGMQINPDYAKNFTRKEPEETSELPWLIQREPEQQPSAQTFQIPVQPQQQAVSYSVPQQQAPARQPVQYDTDGSAQKQRLNQPSQTPQVQPQPVQTVQPTVSEPLAVPESNVPEAKPVEQAQPAQGTTAQVKEIPQVVVQDEVQNQTDQQLSIQDRMTSDYKASNPGAERRRRNNNKQYNWDAVNQSGKNRRKEKVEVPK